MRLHSTASLRPASFTSMSYVFETPGSSSRKATSPPARRYAAATSRARKSRHWAVDARGRRAVSLAWSDRSPTLGVRGCVRSPRIREQRGSRILAHSSTRGREMRPQEKIPPEGVRVVEVTTFAVIRRQTDHCAIEADKRGVASRLPLFFTDDGLYPVDCPAKVWIVRPGFAALG
jgi:hypothetical protein